MKTAIGALATLAFALVFSTVPGRAQEKVGVVTTVIGPVSVARAASPPEPLKFKDHVFVRDRITTGEEAFTRILLGGKVIITARERSTLTITETPDLSTIHLTSGRIAVAVEKSLMKPGERVDVRTPNAIAGVRGTVLIVEAAPDVSTVTVLRGLVHVTRLNPAGNAIGAYTAVGARQEVTVRQNVLPTRSTPITARRAEELSQEFAPPLQAVTSAAIVPDAAEIERVLELAKSEISAALGVQPVGAPTATTPTPSMPSPTALLGVGETVATAPVLSTAPLLSSTPVPTLAPTSLSPTTATSSKSSKYGTSSKYDRSGTNSGPR